MRIAVYGAGAVGGYFGGRLSLGGADVHLLARGPHLTALRERGLRVRSVAGDFDGALHAVDDPAEVGPCDYVLFCVKSFDTESATARLGPLLGPETAVLSLQNGIDNEERLAAAIGAEHVLGGAAFVLAHIAEPGLVAQTGGPRRIVFGELDGRRTPRVERLLELCRAADVDAAIADDVQAVLWDKYAFLCALAGMTATTRLPIDEIRTAPSAWAMFRAIVGEIVALAEAEGVRLENDPVERHSRFAESLEPRSYSSLYHDLVQGRRLELEALHGTAVRRARRAGVPVPMCKAVYAILEPWAAQAAGI